MKTERLAAGYGKTAVLTDVELTLNPGEFTVVIGPNASGKSTLLKTLAAVLKPVEGAVYLSCQELHRIKPRERARQVAAVFTGRPETGLMLVEEVVALGRYPWTGPIHVLGQRDREAVEKAMTKTNISHLRGRKVSELSDGQFQRVMIARALAQEPKVLILDEPTTHLDTGSRLEIMVLLRKLAHEENIIVIASTHEIELALRFADKLILVQSNNVHVFEDADQIIVDDTFRNAFGLNGQLHLSPTTFSIEFRPSHEGLRKHVFVIAGAGTGSRTYRALLKAGCRVSSGVLHENDVDHYVAESLGIETVSEKPFTKVSEQSFQKAFEKILCCDAVVYTCPPIGEQNFRNVELLKKAVENNIPAFALTSDGRFFEQVETVSSVHELVLKILQSVKPVSVREAGL